MALFGEKCHRCGTRTKNKQDDEAICPDCAVEMELMVTASKEESRPCPLDGSKMTKEVAHMVVIDRCPKCKGVWLDGGELERLTSDVESLAVMAMIGGMSGRF